MYKIFLLATILFSVNLASANERCDSLIEEMDLNLKYITFTKLGQKLPKTNEQIKEFCNSGKRLYSASKKFTNCTKPLQKQVITILAKSGRKFQEKSCRRKREFKKLSNFFECMSQEGLDESINRRLISIARMNAARKVDKDKVIPTICCALNILTDSIKNEPARKCNNSNIKTNEYMLRTMDVMGKDLVEFICTKWTTIEDCKQTEPELWIKLNQESSIEELKEISFLKSLVEIMELLE